MKFELILARVLPIILGIACTKLDSGNCYKCKYWLHQRSDQNTKSEEKRKLPVSYLIGFVVATITTTASITSTTRGDEWRRAKVNWGHATGASLSLGLEFFLCLLEEENN